MCVPPFRTLDPRMEERGGQKGRGRRGGTTSALSEEEGGKLPSINSKPDIICNTIDVYNLEPENAYTAI